MLNDGTKVSVFSTRFISDALSAARNRVTCDYWQPVAVRPDGVIVAKRMFGREVRHYVRAAGR